MDENRGKLDEEFDLHGMHNFNNPFLIDILDPGCDHHDTDTEAVSDNERLWDNETLQSHHLLVTGARRYISSRDSTSRDAVV